MTFGELLTTTRDSAMEGLSWSEVWESIQDDFEALASLWTPEERLRNFEMIMAAFVSDDPHVIEPPGTAEFSLPTPRLRICNLWVDSFSERHKYFRGNSFAVALDNAHSHSLQ